MKVLLPLLAVLCFASSGEAQSGLFSSSDVRSYDPGVAPRTPVLGDLVVKPDVLWVTCVVRANNPDPERALYAAHVGFDAVAKRATEVLGAAVEVRPSAVDAQDLGRGKLSGESETSVALTGVLAVPLTGDFWARAQILARTEKLTRELAASAQADKVGYTLGFSQPQARVKDAEQYRAELLKRLAARAREFAEAAAAKGHPLVPASCSVPGAVVQQAATIEEVSVSLQAGCVLQLAPK